MRILQQSPTLRAVFKQKIDAKKTARQQEIYQVLGDSVLGQLGSFLDEFKQARNQFKGRMGEWDVSTILQKFPDTWVMFNNALIPAGNSGNLTEIDHLIIGSKGVFLLEIKTWKGSFSAYNDKWKRREGNNWVEISNSPTSQSAYHQQMFIQWITTIVPNLPDSFVYAPVVFPIAKWLGINNCSVPVFQGVPTLLQTMLNCPECLTPEQVQLIAEAVEDYTLPDNSTPIPKPIPKPKLVKRQSSSGSGCSSQVVFWEKSQSDRPQSREETPGRRSPSQAIAPAIIKGRLTVGVWLAANSWRRSARSASLSQLREETPGAHTHY